MSSPPSSFSTSNDSLLHIRDLYDAALCLRDVWILDHSHVQFFLPFAECGVCCAIDSFKISPPNRFCDQPVVTDLPKFVAADSNVFFPFLSLKRNIDGI